MSDTVEKVQTCHCRAGHTWERPFKKGSKPRMCAKHRHYFVVPRPASSNVPSVVEKEWGESGVTLDEPGYIERWKRVWNDVVRGCAARIMSYAELDYGQIVTYINALRFAEMHRIMAQKEPYYEFRGAVRPHPGWALSEQYEKKARELAIELGIVEAPEVRNPKADPTERQPKRSVSRYQTRLQESATANGLDALAVPAGPDGDVL